MACKPTQLFVSKADFIDRQNYSQHNTGFGDGHDALIEKFAQEANPIR